MAASYETLMRLSGALAKGGLHPVSPWWQETLKRFYDHRTARFLIARVGRGGGKSFTCVLVAINEIVFGTWNVPLGEVHYWAFVSISKEEAAGRILLICKCLEILGIPFERTGDEITLKDQPLGFKVFAAQIGSVSGYRCVGWCADEGAKLKTDQRYTNPLSEVVASLSAMCVTHARDAKRLLVSSPMTLADYHARRFELGDTEEQLTCAAPTWIANPSVTEAETRKLEPDERIWRREYAAIPQAAALAAFEAEAVGAAFLQPLSMGAARRRVGVIDASSGKKDSWTFGVTSWRVCDGRPRLVFDKIDGFEGAFWAQRSGEEVVQLVADHFKAVGVQTVIGDQRESLMLGSAFRRLGLEFTEIPWTSSNKERAVGTVRRWLADCALVLPEHEKLRLELLSFEERVSSSGAFTFGARGTGHDDYVAIVITAAMGDALGLIPGSPNGETTMFDALEAIEARGGKVFTDFPSRRLW